MFHYHTEVCNTVKVFKPVFGVFNATHEGFTGPVSYHHTFEAAMKGRYRWIFDDSFIAVSYDKKLTWQIIDSAKAGEVTCLK